MVVSGGGWKGAAYAATVRAMGGRMERDAVPDGMFDLFYSGPPSQRA